MQGNCGPFVRKILVRTKFWQIGMELQTYPHEAFNKSICNPLHLQSQFLKFKFNPLTNLNEASHKFTSDFCKIHIRLLTKLQSASDKEICIFSNIHMLLMIYLDGVVPLMTDHPSGNFQCKHPAHSCVVGCKERGDTTVVRMTIWCLLVCLHFFDGLQGVS